jgi:hypothetical protein
MSETLADQPAAVPELGSNSSDSDSRRQRLGKKFAIIQAQVALMCFVVGGSPANFGAIRNA